MGRPRKKKDSTQSVAKAPAPSAAVADDGAQRILLDDQRRQFNDREVQCRIAAVEAIRDAEIENLQSRLRLLRSCLSKEQLATPAKRFFEENFPKLSVVENVDNGILELEWKEIVGGVSTNVINSLGAGSFDLAPDFSRRSIELSLLEAAQRQIPRSALETPCQGLQEAFRTPGATAHRLSFGMTPKTLRLPKQGEKILSVCGSPLGVFGEENLEAIQESGGSS
ncbi:translation initiation factor [Wolffia australiana]